MIIVLSKKADDFGVARSCFPISPLCGNALKLTAGVHKCFKATYFHGLQLLHLFACRLSCCQVLAATLHSLKREGPVIVDNPCFAKVNNMSVQYTVS